MLAYLLLPDKVRRPAAVMICVPGHGRGVDDIVGIDEQGSDRTDKAGYQYDFAIQVAEGGMAALAIEPMGFGCRAIPSTRVGPLAKVLPSGGRRRAAGRADDGRLARVGRDADIDYIATRSELDAPRRLHGHLGRRHGHRVRDGARSAHRVALVSGYLNTFRDSIGSLSHCIDNYVPGILNWAEMYDVAGLSRRGRYSRNRARRTTSSRSGEHRELHRGATRSTTFWRRGSRRARGLSGRTLVLGQARYPVHVASSEHLKRVCDNPCSARLAGESMRSCSGAAADCRTARGRGAALARHGRRFDGIRQRAPDASRRSHHRATCH